jgi:exopolyphosphatase/guanosine-5'-triphosphate,3'-diphosphate pyrophosphatase
MHTLAVIDLGSNGARCLVMQVRGTTRQVLLDVREPVKLAEGLYGTGSLSEPAMRRALAALKRFVQEAKRLGATQVRAVATAAVREASNRLEFTRAVAQQTGLRLEVISGTEEARLIALGVLEGAGPRDEALLVDIGGGSTELSATRGASVRVGHSVELGAVRLTELFLHSDPPKEKELRLLEEHVADVLADRVGQGLGTKRRRVVGTAGSIGALGEALRDGARPGPAVVERKALRRLYERLRKMRVAARRKVVEDKRVDTIVAGAAILLGVMDHLDVDEVEVSRKGLRDGLMLDLVSRLGGGLPGSASQDFALREGVKAFGERLQHRAPHAHHVTSLALSLFDQLHALHGLEHDARQLLYAAAMLHDVGAFVSRRSHHKHSAYLIQNGELPGFTDSEKELVAQVARYHRKSHPRPRHAPYMALTPAERQQVSRLAGMLRFADALDRGHKRNVRFVTSTVRGRRVQVKLHGRGNLDLELWAAESGKELLEEALGIVVTVERA